MIETTLIGGLVGLGASVVNGIVDYKKTVKNNEFQLANTQLQIEAAKSQTELNIKEHEVKALDNEHERLITHSQTLEGLRALVRPILTFAFTFFFITEGVVALFFPDIIATAVENPIQVKVLDALNSITGCILGFWFGQRSIDKQAKRMGVA